MTTITPEHGAARAARRARVASLLRLYPGSTEDEIAEMTHWFQKEANALDVGLLASESEITSQYRAFRAEHLDRFGWRHALQALAFVAIILAVFGTIAWQMP